MKPKMQMILFALLAFLAQGALAATIDVSQPTLVTASDYYERGESVLKDSGGTYWLFYGQSYDFQGNYGSGNPDTHHYDIHYKKAASLDLLASATPALVGNLPTGTDRIYQGQTTCVEYDGEIWVIAVDMGDGGQVKAWTTGDGGTNWSVADILPDGTDPFNGTHLWATVFSGKIYLAVNRDGDIDVANYDGVSWNGLHEAVDHEGMPRLYADGSHLYLSYSSWASPSYYIYDFTAPSTWAPTATITGTPDMDCDPFFFKVGSDYVFAFAPWDGTQQLLKYWTATTVAGFDGLTQTSAHMLTAGSYGATPWVDMWPVALEDGGMTTVFYGTEAEGTAAGHGNIAMLEFDWTPGLDHYCYIQNAVDGAGSGDLIDVASGIYREQVKVDGIALTLRGDGIGNTILEAPDPADRSTYQITQWNGSTKTIDAVLGVLSSTNFNLTGFTIDGRETGPGDFYGLHLFDTSADITTCRVEDILYPASPGTGSVVSLVATQSAGGSYSLLVDTVDIPNFQKCGILVMGPGYTFDVRNNTVTNAPTSFLAGNGMQLSYGATGSTLNNDVQGVGYLGEDWAATGILLFESGDVTMSGDVVDNCQTGINYSDWNWIYVHPSAVNIDVEGLDLHDNEFAFTVHLAADNVDLNLDVTDCDFYDNTGDGLDVYGTAVDPWGGGYYPGWSNGDLVVNVLDCNITDTTGWDGIWTDDSSGNANNVTFTVENTTFGNNAEAAIWNNFTQTIDAERCYWGSSEAPPIIRSGGLRTMPPLVEAIGVDLPDQPDRMTVAGGDRASDGVYGPVDYDPWWCDAAMTNLCSESATLAFLPGTNGPINCSESDTLMMRYTPIVGTPALRGYEVTFTAGSEVSFDEFDIADEGALGDIGTQHFEVVDNLDGSFTVSAALLGPTGGLTVADDLFSVEFFGAASGTADVEILSYKLRDLDNGQFYAMILGATIEVDCDAPNVPTLAAEPVYTQGLANTLDWSDESASGAVSYYIERAKDASFSVDLQNSGWIAGTSHEFTGLADDQIYYYRVKAKDGVDNESAWSNVEFSTQDDNDPVSSVDALPTYQTSWAFDVAYTATDQTSDVASVELYYSLDGGAWASYGSGFTLSPIPVDVSGIGEDGTYGWYTVATDNVGNVEAAPGAADATTIVDTTDPAGTFVIDGDATYATSTSVTLDNTVTDLNDVIEMQFSNDGVSWSGWVTYAATHAWILTSGDGVKTVYAEFKDTPGNIWSTSDDIILDTAPPGAASGMSASTGHGKVFLVWTDPGDGDLAYVEVWRGPWHDGSNVSAYPEYDDLPGDLIPTRPADRAAADASAEWTLAGTAPVGDQTFVDNFAPRGIYWYELFARDLAGNYGPPLGDNDRAANYWLGDVFSPFDGYVRVEDINVLGAAFGTVDGADAYNNETDVGPTHDWSRLGIPLTDDVIDFEDLMVFAMNYSVVAPLPRQADANTVAMLTWYQIDETTWALGLIEPCYDLKALTLRADLSAGVSVELSASGTLDHQSAPVFLRNIEGNGMDISLALMGQGISLSGDGELFRVSYSEPVELDDVTLDARDSANHSLGFELGYEELIALPEIYQLARNFPNPFNPKTTIRFDLPEAQDVRLVVFDANGRLVRILVDEVRDPGFHAVDWNGTDERGVRVSSGIYFYRIEAGPLSRTERMVLLK